MKKKYIYITLTALASLGVFFCTHLTDLSARLRKAPTGFAVMELFTSEGCSSCPPAYIVAEGIQDEFRKKNSNVIMLDFHVDYWNSLGWVDPFSDSAYSKRQTNYSKVLKIDDVYTPQAFVNGKTAFVGSLYQKAKSTIQEAIEQNPKMKLSINPKVNQGQFIDVSYELTSLSPDLLINIAITENTVSSNVLKGENAGKTLTHFNVVRSFNTFPVSSEKGTARINYPNFSSKSGIKLVAYVQDAKTMEIYSADSYPLNLN
jgi:hypothetical protein